MSEGAVISPKPENAIKAILIVIASLALFDVMAVFVRMLQPQFTPLELSAYRNILGIIPSFLVLGLTGELRLSRSALYVRQWPLALARGVSVAVAQLCFYTSLGVLEFATVASLAQTSAFFTVIFAIVLLRERVGAWRWSAVFIGFCGAVWILRPGADAFTPAALLPIIAAAGYALPMVMMRWFDDGVSNAKLYIYSAVASGVVTVALLLATTGFSPITRWIDALMLLAMATCGTFAVLLMMLAYRLTQASVLAPFSFVSLITAFIFGFVFFGEAPFATLFPGVILIVAAGAMIMWRERRVK